MLYMIQKKGQLKEWIECNQEDEKKGIAVPGRFNISIYINPERIADWQPEDFREVIRKGNEFKYARLKSIIDIFVYPEKYINEDTGNTYAADILNPESLIETDEAVFK